MRIDYDSPVGKSLARKVILGPRVGLELEYEGCSEGKIEQYPKNWTTTIDHSLRTGGLEFISKPLTRAQLTDSVMEMIKCAKNIGAKVTPRCGLHVHVNATHMTWNELYRFVVYYVLLEPQIFADLAPGREISHFCVPTWTNTALTEHMYSDGQRLKDGIMIPECSTTNWKKAGMWMNPGPGRTSRLTMLNTPKYAALNMASLKKFGTLEFRQAPSTLSAVQIVKWATILLDIQRESKKYGAADDIVRAYDKYGITALCEKVGFMPHRVVDELDQEDAVDTATIIAGHVPINWKQLKWEVA